MLTDFQEKLENANFTTKPGFITKEKSARNVQNWLIVFAKRTYFWLIEDIVQTHVTGKEMQWIQSILLVLINLQSLQLNHT